MRSKLLIAAFVSCALIAPAAALAAPPPRAHPAYTDAAGDAHSNGLLRPNVPAADILAADATADATTLSFVTKVAGPRRLLAAADHYYSVISTSQTTLFSFQGDDSSTATLVLAFAGLDDAGVTVQGTTTIDPATNTITARYPLAEVNAAEQGLAAPGQPPATFSADSVVTNAYTRSQIGSDDSTIDEAHTSFLTFTLGG